MKYKLSAWQCVVWWYDDDDEKDIYGGGGVDWAWLLFLWLKWLKHSLSSIDSGVPISYNHSLSMGYRAPQAKNKFWLNLNKSN